MYRRPAMHVLFVHCHPEPASFNAALTSIGMDVFRERGDSVEISDLYAEHFDPVEKSEHYVRRSDTTLFSPLAEQRHAYKENTLPADVSREIARLERADLVIFQFPIWWHSAPAILKGWMDRVFISGGLYSSTMRYDTGYFRGRRALCSATTGAPEAAFEPGGRAGEIDKILWSTQYSLYYMGFDILPPFVSYGVQGHGFSYADDEGFARLMEDTKSAWRSRLAGIDADRPLRFPGWKDWDDIGRLRPTAETPCPG